MVRGIPRLMTAHPDTHIRWLNSQSLMMPHIPDIVINIILITAGT
jgi:hypothetical protein